MLSRRTTIRILIVLALAGLAALGVYSATRVAAQDELPVATTEAPLRPAQVTADGYVVPVRQAVLSVLVPGRVASVEVAEGQQVSAGDVLISLDNSIQRQALAQAEASLVAAEAGLAQVREGARVEEVAQAEAIVAAAQARLARLANGPTPEQVASARQAVGVAQANLGRVQAGPTPEQLNAAAATLAQAEAAVKQAQAAYDKVSFREDIGALPESLRLEQATNEYNRALASYQNLANGATEAELQVYRQQVAQAEAGLNEVLAGANPADVQAAQAELASAEAALALLKAGPRSSEVAAAEAQVAQARAAVGQAQAALDQTLLRAPFAGTVGALAVSVGEYVAPGAAVVRLGDLTAWAVETDNLTEQGVVRLAVGDPVEVTVDALPGEVLLGTVSHIQPTGEVKRGEVTYQVTVALDAGGLPLRWGLTAAVSVR